MTSVVQGGSPVQTATQLAVITQPAGSASGVAFTTQPVIRVRDALSNTVQPSVASVTAAIASGSGALSGTTTVAAIAGTATFTNLVITGSGAHTVTFTSSGLSSATSSSFTVAGSGSTPDLLNHYQLAGRSISGTTSWSLSGSPAMSGFRDSTSSIAVVADAGTPGGFAFRSTFTSGASDKWAQADFGVNTQKVYTQFHSMLGSGFDVSGIKKHVRFRGPTDLPCGTITIHGGHWNYYLDGYGGAADANHFFADPTTFRNTWHYMEVMVDLSTANLWHGKVWIDDVLVINYSEAVSHAATAVREVWIDTPTFNLPATNNSTFWNDWSISTQPIGNHGP